MTQRLDHARVLIYSHDSFGLGHLRRSMVIAHAMVDQFKGLSVLIVSGSPIIGRFDFRARVDFLRVPGIIKLRSGDYTSLDKHIDLEETIKIRASIIEHTAETFAPHVFLVDKEPLGIKGEVESTLQLMRNHNVTNIVGLRDVMDDDESLRKEWKRKQVLPALESLYDEIWVYGIPQMGDPLKAVNAPKSVNDKSIFTGYLPRRVPDIHLETKIPTEPFILVTPGGGRDGVEVIDWVLRAYELISKSSEVTLPASLIVLGPFMLQDDREAFLERVEKLKRVSAIIFDSHIELLMDKADAVVAMGGYNTFCEILSFDKPALLLPRSTPRQEQLIRAQRAQLLGLVSMLDADKDRSTEKMVDALQNLLKQPVPSQAGVTGLLGGYDTIGQRIKRLLS